MWKNGGEGGRGRRRQKLMDWIMEEGYDELKKGTT